jgi:hypothetical protein
VENNRSGYRCRLGYIDPDHLAADPYPLDGDLCPPAGGTAEIDHPAAGPQQLEAIVEFDQFEGCTRAVTEPARFGNVWVVELTR